MKTASPRYKKNPTNANTQKLKKAQRELINAYPPPKKTQQTNKKQNKKTSKLKKKQRTIRIYTMPDQKNLKFS